MAFWDEVKKAAPLVSPEATFGMLTSAVAATPIVMPYLQYKQGEKAMEQAEAERVRVRKAEEEKTATLEAEVAAEKKRANLKAMERMRRRGHAGTVLGGATSMSLLGSAISGA